MLRLNFFNFFLRLLIFFCQNIEKKILKMFKICQKLIQNFVRILLLWEGVRRRKSRRLVARRPGATLSQLVKTPVDTSLYGFDPIIVFLNLD
jgi:hypothetical protein